MRTMKFCILIELSKERISFLYNRSDSDNGFVPFEGQGSLPLAIYCDGNHMEIGQFAVNEANKKNPNAFIDVFKKEDGNCIPSVTMNISRVELLGKSEKKEETNA